MIKINLLNTFKIPTSRIMKPHTEVKMNKKHKSVPMSCLELSQFYDEFALVCDCMPVSQGLEAMKTGREDSQSAMLDNIKYQVSNGISISDAFREYPDFFDEFQAMILKRAEESGTIVETCKRLAQYYFRRHIDKGRLKIRLIYLILFAHVFLLLLPLKLSIISRINIPKTSLILLPLSAVYALSLCGIIFWKLFGHNGIVRKIVDKIILSLPIIGKFELKLSISWVFMSLANLLNAGIESVQSVRKAAHTAGNRIITARMLNSLFVLEKGGTFVEYFTSCRILSASQLRFLSIGEQCGAMVESLEKIVLHIDEENGLFPEAMVRNFGAIAYLVILAVILITLLYSLMNFIIS